MPYAIVAERQGLSVYNRVETAAEALTLAIARRRAGCEAVYVRDQAWEVVPAGALEQAAESQHRPTAAPAQDSSITVKVGAAPDGAKRTTASEARSGRVRVFKAGGAQRSRG